MRRVQLGHETRLRSTRQLGSKGVWATADDGRFSEWAHGSDVVGRSQLRSVQEQGALFRVSGRLHKGIVCITLAWDDTYTITLLNLKFEVKQTRTDVYFDELVNNIDHMVETR